MPGTVVYATEENHSCCDKPMENAGFVGEEKGFVGVELGTLAGPERAGGVCRPNLCRKAAEAATLSQRSAGDSERRTKGHFLLAILALFLLWVTLYITLDSLALI